MSKKKNVEPAASVVASEKEAQEALEANKRRALQLFSAPPSFAALVASAERRNLPRLYKPDEIPIGGCVHGEIIKVIKSMKSTIKGKLLWLKQVDGTEFMFPLTGTIRQALAASTGDVEKDRLEPDMKGEIGKYFFAKRLPDGISKEFKKTMFMFDVFTVPVEKAKKMLAPAGAGE